MKVEELLGNRIARDAVGYDVGECFAGEFGQECTALGFRHRPTALSCSTISNLSCSCVAVGILRAQIAFGLKQ